MNLFRKGLRRGVRFLAAQRIIPPKLDLWLLHVIELGRIPDINHPKDLNEKLMWLAFNSDTSQWSKLADKYEVRKYVEECGLSHILIPLLGVYDTVDTIPFNMLPSSFVIKSNNGSSQTIITTDKTKLDVRKACKEIENWQSEKFGLASGEVHYLKIQPRIVVEKLISGENGSLPVDYKFMCFNGKVHSCLVCSERDDKDFECKRNLIDPHTWKEFPNSVSGSYHGKMEDLKRPENLDEMIKVAERLSSGFPFVRVDLYNVDGKIYFGELTFSPSGFRIASITHPMLLEMGNLLQL